MMAGVPRYREMGIEFNFRIPLSELQTHYERRFTGIQQYTSQTMLSAREDDVYYCLEILSANHLQLPGTHSPEQWLERGIDCARHHFLDEWEIDGDPRHCLVWEKREKPRELQWYKAFSRGLILLLLSDERGERFDEFCCWPWAELEPEYAGMGDDLEVEIAYMFIIIAAAFRSEPMEGFDELLDKMQKCRLRRPKLLLKSWEAVLAKDQKAFDQAMAKSIQHCIKSKNKDPRSAMMEERLAFPQTAICLAAQRLGLSFPDLPRELANYIMTRESIGLDSTKGI